MANNTCVCCGQIIPEGRQVCPQCEEMAYAPKYDPAEFFSAEREKKTGGSMKSRKYLESELREALSNIYYQMDYGYLDIGVHDQLEMAIVKRAVNEWESKYLNRKKYRGWCET